MGLGIRFAGGLFFLTMLAAFSGAGRVIIIDKTPPLDVSPPAIAAEGTLELRWTVSPRKSGERPLASDWIGLFVVGRNGAPLWRQTTNGSTSGKVAVRMPAEEGLYEFRYVSDGRPVPGLKSNPVPVLRCRAEATPKSRIRHLVVVVPENHSFDSYFGRYCKGPTGQLLTCTSGANCCEAGPEKDPSGTVARLLTDKEHGDYDPPHSKRCELDAQHGGLMDRYVTGICGNARNVAQADATTVGPYWKLAEQYAMGDRVFQSVAGASSSNNMYFSGARYLFEDNDEYPNAKAGQCDGTKLVTYTESSVGDLLTACGVSWTYYPEGYGAAAAAHPRCLGSYPKFYDPSDVPFQYYRTSVDNPAVIRDYEEFQKELKERRLPAVSYIKPLGIRTEHPGGGITITDGVTFTTGIVKSLLDSPYADDTLILITPDEGGGYFDHVRPPADSRIDNQPYGNRIYMLAIGRFAKKNHISHVQLEHSSIVRFIEWNWLDGKQGQLGSRDTVVKNLGSLLDPAETGVTVPE